MRKQYIMLLILLVICLIIVSMLNTTAQFDVVEEPELICFNYDNISDEDFGIEELTILNRNNCKIVYKAGTNEVKELYGMFSTKKVENKEDALIALLSVRTLFEIEDYDFCCSNIEKRADVMIYTLNQVYNGVFVEGGFFEITVKNNGEVSCVKGNYVNDINICSEALVSYNKGVKKLILRKTEKVKSVQLVVCSLKEDANVLCWKYTIVADDPINNRYIYLDANAGTVYKEIMLTIS